MSRARDLADYVSTGVTSDELNLLDGSDTGPLSHRNMVVNGDMRIAQRGTSAVTATGEYPVDRFRSDFDNDGSFSLQQVSESPENFQHSIKWTVTGTDTALASTQIAYIRTILEGQDIAHLNWGSSDARTVTLSFYIKSSVTGTFGGAIWNNDFDRSYPFSYTVSSTNWERKSITIPGDTTGTWLTTNGRGINVAVLASAGSNYTASAGSWGAGGKLAPTGANNIMATNSATYHITGVQLELGSVANPFEHRSYGEELQRCMRYCQRYPEINLVGVVDTSTASYHSISFTFPFRASPSLTINTLGSIVKEGLSWYSNTGITLPASGSFHGVLFCTQSGGNAMSRLDPTRLNNGCDLTFHAEF